VGAFDVKLTRGSLTGQSFSQYLITLAYNDAERGAINMNHGEEKLTQEKAKKAKLIQLKFNERQRWVRKEPKGALCMVLNAVLVSFPTAKTSVIVPKLISMAKGLFVQEFLHIYFHENY
jgi:hypothetical protein